MELEIRYNRSMGGGGSFAVGASLFDKIWDLHSVRELASGQTQLWIGLHLIHEVTSPQGFQMLEDAGLPVMFPERTVATVDHILPTESHARPLADPLAERMLEALERSCARHDIRLFRPGSGRQGIVHVIGPELGLTQPGQTIACGDSHTSTHGAFGAVAFGIGTSQVRDVLASQCLALERPKVRRIEVSGALGACVYAKDVILHVIRRLGAICRRSFGTPRFRPGAERPRSSCNASMDPAERRTCWKIFSSAVRPRPRPISSP